MKRTISYIFLFILFFVNSFFAQSDYKIELSGGRVTSALENTLLPYWDTGWSFGITGSKKLSEGIELTSNFSYQNFKFQKALVIFPPNVDPPGFHREISGGDNSNVFDFTLGFRVFTSGRKITTFFSLSAGLQYISQGKVLESGTSYFIIDSTLHSTTVTYLFNNNGRYHLMGIGSFGVGLSVNITQKINLITEAKLVSTFKDFTTYSILSAGIQYSL